MSGLAQSSLTVSDPRREARVGVFYALAAVLFWGVVPGYFKLMQDVPPGQILAHRVIWSVVLLVWMVARKRLWGEVRQVFRSPKALGALCISTLLIATNWFTFIYAVTTDRVMQTSLGYYMQPLIAVLLGMVLLKERMRPAQWVCVGLAATAVGMLTFMQGQFPGIPLILATSFALYGLVRKTAPAGPLAGLFVETTLLFPAALAAAILGPALGWPGVVAVSREVLIARAHWLVLAGVITAVPLLWFANAAKRVKLSTLGLLQYLAPTLSFSLAVFAFGEPFTRPQMIAFPLIWLALVIFSVDSVRAYGRGVGGRQ